MAAKRPKRTKPARPATTAAGARVEAALATLRTELLAALGEIPRAEDFQPLADHLYAFAEAAPGLSKNLENVTELLLATQQSWSESLMKLPRAEDYEPLAAPLREFARVAPPLAETLAEMLRALRSGSVAAQPVHGATLAAALAEAADRLAAARRSIQEALDSLPRDDVYSRFASQLRELATVSPSLMEWMRQIPALSLPLGGAIAGLEQAAQELHDAEQSARLTLQGASATSPSGPSSPPRSRPR